VEEASAEKNPLAKTKTKSHEHEKLFMRAIHTSHDDLF
jgi:hypothetical protein